MLNILGRTPRGCFSARAKHAEGRDYSTTVIGFEEMLDRLCSGEVWNAGRTVRGACIAGVTISTKLSLMGFEKRRGGSL